MVTIKVTPVNDPPVATDLDISTNEDMPVSDTVTASDIDGDTLTYEKLTDPANGTITAFNTSTGQFTYQPNANYNGPDSFTFMANDGAADSNVATVTINVLAAPDTTPPISTFDNPRSHQIIETEIVQLSLTGNSEDKPNPGGSGVASAQMRIYRIVDEETAQGEGFFERQEEGGFFNLTCHPLPQDAVQIELVSLSLTSTVDPMVVTWAQNFTPPDAGVYCAIVHATDNAGNVENTGVAGPFAFKPPAAPPPPGGGGGVGGGGGGGTPNADLSLTKTVVGGDPATVGTTFTYTLTVSNSGPSNATNVVVTDVLPTTLTYVSSTASQGSYDNTTGKWTVGNLTVGSSATLQLTVTVTSAGTITNFASSVSSENDPTPANNTATYVFALGGVAGAQTGPVPQVLGVQTEALPRTGGMPVAGMFYLSWLAPILERFRSRKLKK